MFPEAPEQIVGDWYAVAVFGERMIDVTGLLQGLLECDALAARLAAGQFTRRLAQGTGLLGQAIRRWVAIFSL
ncbi:hypothetical protein [Massilia genomosp. 1]|uniref:hypothetical protein n=1 Tax=Massilia genomosp. 1 TaxID=2609280 RepID=UPI0014227130|nr:hypothetical protein [Massilia genomosp. 1]